MLRALVLSLALAACATAPGEDLLLTRISELQPDPDIAAFLAEEARQAGVSRIVLTDNSGMIQEVGQPAYGLARFDGRTRRTTLYFNVERSGGSSLTNISHEIAHAHAYRRGCFGHGNIWLNAHLDMAARFETAFPGVLWSGQAPTANVEAKRVRYSGASC